ncbi:MAG TPA: universal stress protein [Burkholderiaceae bacterium]|nr:universal stress protein [Burkholderiaceae bacterium]HQR70936.1 universal stress protein [Burkholderiaceae bacterium]
MIRSILLGYDGSESGAQAFDFALDLARKYGAELHILAVARPPEFAEEVEAEAVIENSRQHYDKILAKLRHALAKETVKSQLHVVVGHPAEQLVRYAERHRVDHIVVGHRGHSRFDRWLIGSVARQIIAYAHCAVTVVRR